MLLISTVQPKCLHTALQSRSLHTLHTRVAKGKPWHQISVRVPGRCEP